MEESIKFVRALLEIDEFPEDALRHMSNILDALFVIAQVQGRPVKIVNSVKKKEAMEKGGEELDEYFLEQE